MSLKTSGFTLTELLVTITILLTLLTISFFCLDTVTRTFSTVKTQTNTYRAARIVIQALRHDLKNAQVDIHTPFYLNPTNEIIAEPTDQPFAATSDTLFFFTKQPSAGNSNLCAVGYYLILTSNQSGELHRYFKNSNLTWYAADTNTGLLPHAINPTNPLFPAIGNPVNHETLAHNITAFHIHPLREDLSTVLPWLPQEKPKLVEISFELREKNTTKPFKLSIPLD